MTNTIRWPTLPSFLSNFFSEVRFVCWLQAQLSKYVLPPSGAPLLPLAARGWGRERSLVVTFRSGPGGGRREGGGDHFCVNSEARRERGERTKRDRHRHCHHHHHLQQEGDQPLLSVRLVPVLLYFCPAQGQSGQARPQAESGTTAVRSLVSAAAALWTAARQHQVTTLYMWSRNTLALAHALKLHISQQFLSNFRKNISFKKDVLYIICTSGAVP